MNSNVYCHQSIQSEILCPQSKKFSQYYNNDLLMHHLHLKLLSYIHSVCEYLQTYLDVHGCVQ